MTEYWEDEVDGAVRRLRADTPEMAEAAFAAGRARLAAGAPRTRAAGSSRGWRSPLRSSWWRPARC